MSRNLLAALAALAVGAGPALAGAAAPPPSAHQKFASAQVVVVGKVTAIEKNTVDASSPYIGAKDKVAYKVAVVKIETDLGGAAGLTHIKVGFVPSDPNAPPPRGSGGVIRPREPVPELTDGQYVLVYLCKHPTADFYVMPYRNLPANLGAPNGTVELEQIKKFAAATADPLKGLKSDKSDVRAETAALLVAKYRTYPALAAGTELVAIPAEESKLILKAIADADWDARAARTPAAVEAFFQLGFTDKDGWKQPQPKPGENYYAAIKAAYGKWLDGPGKDYVIKKVVAKK
ncbi:MAG: hypothetical protein FJ304_26850 [Planctomycetes bacterium]|nr:hypothetical protein [Planctomycetota bacterium]